MFFCNQNVTQGMIVSFMDVTELNEYINYNEQIMCLKNIQILKQISQIFMKEWQKSSQGL